MEHDCNDSKHLGVTASIDLNTRVLTHLLHEAILLGIYHYRHFRVRKQTLRGDIDQGHTANKCQD